MVCNKKISINITKTLRKVLRYVTKIYLSIIFTGSKINPNTGIYGKLIQLVYIVPFVTILIENKLIGGQRLIGFKRLNGNSCLGTIFLSLNQLINVFGLRIDS